MIYHDNDIDDMNVTWQLVMEEVVEGISTQRTMKSVALLVKEKVVL